MGENKQKKFKTDLDANWKKFQEKWEVNRIKTAEDWEKGWKKVQEDWDTGLQKLQDDWEKGINHVTNDSKQISSIKKKETQPTTIQSPPISTTAKTSITTPLQDNSNKDFQQSLVEFKSTVDTTLNQWQDQWNLQVKQWQENNKQNAEKFRQNVENSSKKMQQFFDQTNQQMKSNIQKLETDSKTQDKAKRDKFYSDFRKMHANWNDFVIQQQHKFEKNMMTFNKKAIKTEMKILLYTLPFIFIIFVFLMIYNQFFK